MRLIRRLLLAAVLAVSATLLVPAGPAHAAGQEVKICFPVGTTPGGVTVWDCHTIVMPELKPKPPWWPPECLSCPPAFDFWDHKLDPKVQLEYLDRLGQGFGHLAESKLAEDPEAAEELREKAAQTLLSSAEVLGNYELELSRVGWADLENNEFYEDPTPTPVLEAAGKNLAAGLRLMQEALGDPSPQPSIEAAMERFDEAYANLTQLGTEQK
ncbi:hypothetical protein GCM10027447_05060 [Glycomyces halotolerans]